MIDPDKYFDYNATSPLSAAAREAWLKMADDHWENPSSLYREAGEARRLLEDLRECLADALHIDEAERIVFTSGATEGNNAVIQHWSQGDGKIAISAVEHPCVRASAETYFSSERVTEVPVDPGSGQVDREALGKMVSSQKLAGVSVMAANNETGTLQPWPEILSICRESQVPFHCDAAQWFGKHQEADFSEVDFVTGSAHKFGGPKGVGFLVLPEDFEDSDFAGQIGGPQENGRRGGTEDLPGIAAMVAAFLAPEWNDPLDPGPRDDFEASLETEAGMKVVGKGGPRLANTSMIILPFEKNLKWLTRLSQRGFGVSTGSACSAGRGNPSQVMMAMGLDFEEMGRVLRISGGPGHGAAEWAALAEAIKEVKSELEG